MSTQYIPSKCEIEILALPVLGEAIAVQFGVDPTIIYEASYNVRGGSRQFSRAVSSPPNDLLEQAGLLAGAISLDYAPGGLLASFPMTVSVQGNTVILEGTEFQYNFTVPGNTPAWANITATPGIPISTELSIGEITAAEASADKCDDVRYEFTVEDATYPFDIIYPVNKVVNSAADQWFEYARHHFSGIQLRLDDGVTQPEKLMPAVEVYEISEVEIIESTQGATVTINTELYRAGVIAVELEYNIGNGYQLGNVFYSVGAGTYTASVRDQFGCVRTQEFTVQGVSIDKPEPYFSIEEGNSLMFYKSSVFVPCGDERPNFLNAPIADQLYFNCEPNYYSQLVQKCDNTKIQIRSNYDTNTVSIVDCDGEEVAAPLTNIEKTNILLKDKRDCQLKAGAEGKTNVFYIGGNLYEPDTTDVIGEYAINTGRLPKFANDGNIEDGIALELSSTSLNGVFNVEAAVYDSDIEAYCLQINGNFNGTDGEAGITQANYNDEAYNIWEFVIDWNLLDEGNYRVIVSSTDPDPRYNDVSWLSEWISNLEVQSDHTVLEYTSDRNVTNIDYTTGIVFKIRVPARFVRWRNGGESENIVSDDGTRRQLHGIVADEVQLELDPVPQYVRKKIELAAINTSLKINGVTSVAVEKGDGDPLLDEQNMFHKYTAWFQFGEPVVISSGSGLVSGSERVLGVNANVLGL